MKFGLQTLIIKDRLKKLAFYLLFKNSRQFFLSMFKNVFHFSVNKQYACNPTQKGHSNIVMQNIGH